MEQKKSLKAKIAASKTEFDVAEKKVFDCQETYNKLVAKQDALINAERETKIYRDEVKIAADTEEIFRPFTIMYLKIMYNRIH